jgi:hypothetical protein
MENFILLQVRNKVIGFLLILLSALWVSASFAQSPINLSFGTDEIGKFPSGWLALEANNAVKVYTVQAEGEKKFLHADSKGSAIQIGYSKKWALKDFSVLQWQWRADLFPVGSNEQEKNRNDSVLGLYVVFGNWPFIRAIKYIWSDTLPMGASFNSTFAKGTKVIVVRSGRSLMGTWVKEKRDVFLDYQQLFGEGDKNPIATGLAILTDSDHTNSHAIGDYADILVLGTNGEKPARP